MGNPIAEATTTGPKTISIAVAGCQTSLRVPPYKQVRCRGFGFTGFEWPGILEAQAMARILIIDDEPDMRVLLEQTLKSAGHEVILAADGREGAMQHYTSPADLVITDLNMPIQDGSETIREFRIRFPAVAIIAMSETTDTGTMLCFAPNLAAVGILRKPFVADELIAAVAKALGGQSPAC